MNHPSQNKDGLGFELSKRITVQILNSRKPRMILDAPCGSGWLLDHLEYKAEVDGVDLFESPKSRYRRFMQHDLDHGLSAEWPDYDCIVCCEGIEHLGNPMLFFKSAFDHLHAGGFLILTTPNTWHPAARMRFLARGFFPGFSCSPNHIRPGEHIHLIPWSFPQLYLHLKLAGFRTISLQPYDEHCPKHFWEKIVAIPQILYGRHKRSRASDEESRRFWEVTLLPTSLYARQLILVAEVWGGGLSPTKTGDGTG